MRTVAKRIKRLPFHNRSYKTSWHPRSPFKRIIFHLRAGRSQWSRGLRRRSAAARLLGLWARIPPGAWTSVCCECYVLLSRTGLCDELATRPEESYRLWCVVVCDFETSRMRNHNQMWLSLHRRCITGYIFYMPLIMTVKYDCWMSSDKLQWYWEIKKIYVLSIFTGLARLVTCEGKRQTYYSPTANPSAVPALYTHDCHQHTNRTEHTEYRRQLRK